MLRKKQIEGLLQVSKKNCIRMGKSYGITKHEIKLKDLFSWHSVDILCMVLEIDSCLIWNEIIAECPNLGEIAECAE